MDFRKLLLNVSVEDVSWFFTLEYTLLVARPADLSNHDKTKIVDLSGGRRRRRLPRYLEALVVTVGRGT